MKPYYQDQDSTIYLGRCEDVLPEIAPTGASTHLLTDPPYFKVKRHEAWDNQWDKSHQFLTWTGEWLDLAKPLLSPDASIWVFASTDLTSSVERVVAERFRVLNTIRWVKQGGSVQARRVSMPAQRSFVSPWEGIIFAEQKYDPYKVAIEKLHQEVYAHIGEYFKRSWIDAGIPGIRVGPLIGYSTALPGRWAVGATLPTDDAYEGLRELVGHHRLPRDLADIRNEFESLQPEWQRRCQEIGHLRRPFDVSDRALLEDVWTFPHISGNRPGKHPAQKPLGILAHMIQATTRTGDTILDPFMGSGSTLEAARNLGRKSIGIEMDERWAESAARRLSSNHLQINN